LSWLRIHFDHGALAWVVRRLGLGRRFLSPYENMVLHRGYHELHTPVWTLNLVVRHRRDIPEIDKFWVFESAMVARLLAVLQRGDVVLDIGANMGLFACAIALSSPVEVSVHAFEPNPITAEKASENVHRNGCTQRAEVHA
jgi:protein-L-isoaspartate O-methyltransferase